MGWNRVSNIESRKHVARALRHDFVSRLERFARVVVEGGDREAVDQAREAVDSRVVYFARSSGAAHEAIFRGEGYFEKRDALHDALGRNCDAEAAWRDVVAVFVDGMNASGAQTLATAAARFGVLIVPIEPATDRVEIPDVVRPRRAPATSWTPPAPVQPVPSRPSVPAQPDKAVQPVDGRARAAGRVATLREALARVKADIATLDYEINQIETVLRHALHTESQLTRSNKRLMKLWDIRTKKFGQLGDYGNALQEAEAELGRFG